MADKQGWKRLGAGALWVLALTVAALLMTFAQHTPEARWLGWVTLLPLFFAIRELSPSRAALGAGWWGLCLCLFSSIGPFHSLPFAPRSFAFLACVPALYAFLGALQTRRVGFSPLILGLGWVGVELALQPLAMRHGLLASTQDGGLALRVLGFVGGWFLVSFFIAYVNASLLEMLTVACGMILAEDRPAYERLRLVRVIIRELYLADCTHCLRPMAPRPPPAF